LSSPMPRQAASRRKTSCKTARLTLKNNQN